MFYEQEPGANSRKVGGTIYVAKRQTVRELNEVGATIWALLADKTSIDSIVDSIVEEYSVEKDIARRDIEEFISSMMQHGLVRKSDG